MTQILGKTLPSCYKADHRTAKCPLHRRRILGRKAAMMFLASTSEGTTSSEAPSTILRALEDRSIGKRSTQTNILTNLTDKFDIWRGSVERFGKYIEIK